MVINYSFTLRIVNGGPVMSETLDKIPVPDNFCSVSAGLGLDIHQICNQSRHIDTTMSYWVKP